MNSTQTNAKKSRKYQRHKVAKQLLTRSRSHKKMRVYECVLQSSSDVFSSPLSPSRKKN